MDDAAYFKSDTWLVKNLGEIHSIPNRKICFIIGAGASVTSGISAGYKLVEKWLNRLREFDDNPGFNELELKDWATAENLGIKGFSYDKAAEFYPQIFEKCFAHDADQGYHDLEEEMRGKEPHIGYILLARIMEKTRHRIVVTTNFDNLVSDAISIYTGSHYLICGHESLTGFVRPSIRRPLIAKIHRDLLMNPINDPEGTDVLPNEWKDALRRVLSDYTPVVLGYGGNDGSLMGFLSSLKTSEVNGGIYWCYMKDTKPGEHIVELVKNLNGRLIAINGFDEFMISFAERLFGEQVLPEFHKQLQEKSDSRIEQFRKVAEEGTDSFVKKVEKDVSLSNEVADKDDWWSWELAIRRTKELDKKEELYREAIEHLPDSADLYGSFAMFFHVNKKNIDEAEALYKKALELNPGHGLNTGNFALFAESVLKKYDDAEALYKRAIELEPGDANTVGNYAYFKEGIRKEYDEAERLYQRALQLDSNRVNAVINYAYFKENIRKEYDEAEKFYRHALDIAPDDANTCSNFAIFLYYIRKDYKQAEQFYQRSLALGPNNPDINMNYAEHLLVLGKYDESKKYCEKAIGLRQEGDVSIVGDHYLLAVGIKLNGGNEQKELSHIKYFLEENKTSNNWEFGNLYDYIKSKLNQSEYAYYKAMGDVIVGQEDIASLEKFPEWGKVTAVPITLI